jgi:hypothetical protein
MGSLGFLNFVQRVCPCMNGGEGASNDRQGASNDSQGAPNDSQGASNDGQEASNDSQGALDDGQGASNDGQGALDDSQGASNDGQQALNESPRTSTRSQPISIDRIPSPPAGCYRVYHVLFLGQPSHESIFIETHEQGQSTGHLYHVTGNILRGMTYDDKAFGKPQDAGSFEKLFFIGVILSSDIPRFEAVCRSVEVPGRQVDLRGRRLDRSKLLRRCGEWTADAISALHQQGIVRQ